MNNITSEVYRFAGSQVKSELEEIVKAGTFSNEGSVLVNAIAREVAIFLKGNEFDDDTRRIRENLETASSNYMVRVETMEKATYEQCLRALMAIRSGAGPVYGFPFYVIAIHYYAGERLLSIMNSKINDGTVDRAWHSFSEAFAGRVKEFINIFISFYRNGLEHIERDYRERFLALAKRRGTPESEARLIMDTVDGITGSYYKRFTALVLSLDASLARMKQYVEATPSTT